MPLSSSRRLVPYLSLGLFVACRGGAITHIELDGADRVTVEAGTVVEDLLGDLGFDAFTDMNIVEAKELQNQGVEPGDIDGVQLVSFELSVVSPSEGDLSFFESMSVYVESPGLEPVLIAEAFDFPQDARVVSFDVYDTDLTEYVVSESMTLSTDIVAGRPSEETVVKASYLLDVGVTLQGARSQACN